MIKRVTVPEIMAAKGKRKLTELTAYDYPTALWADKSGVDMLLVGDSLAMVVLGPGEILSRSGCLKCFTTPWLSAGVPRGQW